MAEELLSEGDHAPEIDLPATRDGRARLSMLRGQLVVIYFYPKDRTPICTWEGRAFGDRYTRFRELGAEVLGISRDTLASHERFAARHRFPFPLLADPDGQACAAYGVLKRRSLGSPGLRRATFVIDGDGIVRHIHSPVKVSGHADEVLGQVRELVG